MELEAALRTSKWEERVPGKRKADSESVAGQDNSGSRFKKAKLDDATEEIGGKKGKKETKDKKDKKEKKDKMVKKVKKVRRTKEEKKEMKEKKAKMELMYQLGGISKK
ncbi:hypothetical protein BJ508DRAFT_419544 [Ascobolus immersus RN42]|uniref:Uncharacterized protein n=1 Tax=Ascobolus immersus RN42 TaxID=1160509 RepID=A0A3N4HHM2_ASCIM|nr:hypothetical protein BJ508DRAFT_419544 [Ascobolus immersus RN42]